MKRIISLILTITLLSLCLGVSSIASISVKFSEDFGKMYISDQSYSRLDSSMLARDDIQYKDISVTLSDAQKETVRGVSISSDSYMDVVYATVSYKDGSTLNVSFIKDSLLDDYMAIVNGTAEEYVIDFEYPYGNRVNAKRGALFSEKTKLGEKELEYCNYFTVYAQNEQGTLRGEKGALLIYDDEYYYVDYEEAGLYYVSSERPFSPYEYDSLSVRRITDVDLCDEIEDAEEKFYNDDFGFLYNDKFSESISTAFILFVLVIIPLVCLAVSLIFIIRSKGFYRKMSIAICSLSAASLATVAVIFAIIQIYS